jgi:hypothetical protein
MDDLLKALATVGLELDAGENAIEEGAIDTAIARLDAADDGLAALRNRWPELGARERQVLGVLARPERGRLDAARARLPRRSAISMGVAEFDPEEALDPAA